MLPLKIHRKHLTKPNYIHMLHLKALLTSFQAGRPQHWLFWQGCNNILIFFLAGLKSVSHRKHEQLIEMLGDVCSQMCHGSRPHRTWTDTEQWSPQMAPSAQLMPDEQVMWKCGKQTWCSKNQLDVFLSITLLKTYYHFGTFPSP